MPVVFLPCNSVLKREKHWVVAHRAFLNNSGGTSKTHGLLTPKSMHWRRGRGMTPAGLKDRALQIQVTIEGWYLGWSEAEVGLGSGTSTCCSSRSHFGSVFPSLSFKRSVKQTPFSITSEWGVLRQSPNSSSKDYWASSKHLSLVGGSLCLLHISRSCSCWETFTLRKECSGFSSVTVRMIFKNCWLTSVCLGW